MTCIFCPRLLIISGFIYLTLSSWKGNHGIRQNLIMSLMSSNRPGMNINEVQMILGSEKELRLKGGRRG
ncbi:uncharacterized, partial [Tachysurus ichikawai]